MRWMGLEVRWRGRGSSGTKKHKLMLNAARFGAEDIETLEKNPKYQQNLKVCTGAFDGVKYRRAVVPREGVAEKI